MKNKTDYEKIVQCTPLILSRLRLLFVQQPMLLHLYHLVERNVWNGTKNNGASKELSNVVFRCHWVPFPSLNFQSGLSSIIFPQVPSSVNIHSYHFCRDSYKKTWSDELSLHFYQCKTGIKYYVENQS